MTSDNALTTVTDIQPAIDLVINSVDSIHTRRSYSRALYDFMEWWESENKPLLTKMTVNRYKAEVLEPSGYSPATINLRLSAIKKLANEAADNEMIEQSQANGINRIKGVKSAGVRTGNWLELEQAQALLNAPDTNTLKGIRDRAILSVLIGAGLRRSETAALKFDQIQQRDSRWVILDISGKGNRVRTVPISSWVKMAIDEWTTAADIYTGFVFRPLYKGGKVAGEKVTPMLIYRVADLYAKELGFNTLAVHDLRRTHAKLALKGGAQLDQIQLTLGHASLRTTQKYLGTELDLQNAPSDHLGLRLE